MAFASTRSLAATRLATPASSGRTMSAPTQAEPWMSGTKREIPVIVRPLVYTFAQVREDVNRHAAHLNADQLWQRPGRVAAVGFHLRHIPGSVDRLVTYLEGNQLTTQQLEFLKHEEEPGADFHQLYLGLDHQLSAAEDRLLKLDTSDFAAPRYIGRKRLEVTFLGLIVHIAEHTQRHLGQLVTTAKLVQGQA